MPKALNKRPRRIAATLLAASAVVFGGFAAQNAAAQVPSPFRKIESSPLAGVTFPTPSAVWSGDPRLKDNSLTAASSYAGRTCGDREYYVWQTPNDDIAQATLTKTNKAFTDAGWTLTLITQLGDGELIGTASRSGTDLVIDWLPTDNFIALLLCKALPKAG